MSVKFYDRQDEANAMNGKDFEMCETLIEEISNLQNRHPFFCEIVGKNRKLTVGFGVPWSCVQFSQVGGEPPYLMAMEKGTRSDGKELLFMINNTVSSVPFRYALSKSTLRNIITFFFENEARSPSVEWDEI
jgi:hypothetical protein